MLMARRWNKVEEKERRDELHRLYVVENRTMTEIAKLLDIGESTVFQRMVRLGIPSIPEKKETYIAKRRNDIVIPRKRSPQLAEFFGIMLGDGKLSHYQAVVNLGTKEFEYAEYICDVMRDLFGVRPKIAMRRKNGFKDVYLGSLDLTEWLQKEGMVFNKVLSQVDVPPWIFTKREYMIRFLRGFFDTDGSVYRLRFGIQISLTNKSAPLLASLQKMLHMLGYHPSGMSAYRVYVTRREEVTRFFQEVSPANNKHQQRFQKFFREIWAGSPVGSGARL